MGMTYNQFRVACCRIEFLEKCHSGNGLILQSAKKPHRVRLLHNSLERIQTRGLPTQAG